MPLLKIHMLAPFGIRPKGTLLARMLPLAQALARRGHEVAIYAPPLLNPQDAGTRIVLEGVAVEHTRAPRLPGPLGAVEQVALLYARAVGGRPDLVHLFKPKGFGGLAMRLPRAVNIPLVLDSDDWEGWGGWNDLLPYPRLARSLFAWQERDLPGRARAVTVASRTLERQVRGFGAPAERIFYLPNGTDAPVVAPQAAGSADRSPRILLYTRFWEFDVRDVVAALAGITARCPAARLLVVGRGEHGEEHELLRLAERAGILAQIDYRGWIEPDALPGVLRSADVALAPMDNTLINRARGLAKLLELMELGLPIVASRVGQAQEYLEHAISALLVEPGNPGALAGAALTLLNDEALRRRLGANALLAAARFSWDRLAGVAEEAYAAAHSAHNEQSG